MPHYAQLYVQQIYHLLHNTIYIYRNIITAHRALLSIPFDHLNSWERCMHLMFYRNVLVHRCACPFARRAFPGTPVGQPIYFRHLNFTNTGPIHFISSWNCIGLKMYTDSVIGPSGPSEHSQIIADTETPQPLGCYMQTSWSVAVQEHSHWPVRPFGAFP